MISYLKGIISYVGTNYLEVVVNDLGYKVFTIGETLDKAKIGKESELYTHQYVREDALDLYGFDSREKLDLFEKLIGVSGIGPKTALNVLSAATIEEIETAIVNDDVSVLTKVSGIGAKTAERIVLELKNKYKGRAALGTKISQSSENTDVIDALVGLGYAADQARSALRQIDKKIKGADEKIKACLRILGK